VTIQDIIQARQITEVVHFTTHRGLLGALHSRAVKSRMRLPAEVDLKYIYTPNAEYRKDKAWLDYVNLSISRINCEFSVGMRDSEGAKVIPLGHAEKRAINFGEVSGQS
jgi:hypothetical protein